MILYSHVRMTRCAHSHHQINSHTWNLLLRCGNNPLINSLLPSLATPPHHPVWLWPIPEILVSLPTKPLAQQNFVKLPPIIDPVILLKNGGWRRAWREGKLPCIGVPNTRMFGFFQGVWQCQEPLEMVRAMPSELLCCFDSGDNEWMMH